ncbi:MAG: hypothetical protein HY567_02095 [Candidatus Kerfeldbacteria bacterium]|nr:hypothetical protein [Candidatus Kerfeldbacteria bacterium]
MALTKTIARIFRLRTNVLLLLFLTVGWYMVFVGIPVLTIPGNSLAFQLSIFTDRDYVLMAGLALLASLFTVIQIELFRRHRGGKRWQAIGKAGAGGASATLAAILASAACSSCVAAILGFLGFGTVLTIIQYRWYVVLVAIVFMLISIIFTLRHLDKPCEKCIKEESGKSFV